MSVDLQELVRSCMPKDDLSRAAWAAFALRLGDPREVAAFFRSIVAAAPPPIQVVLHHLIPILDGTDPHWRVEFVSRLGNPLDGQAADLRRKLAGELSANLLEVITEGGGSSYRLAGLSDIAVAGELLPCIMKEISGSQPGPQLEVPAGESEKERWSDDREREQAFVAKARQKTMRSRKASPSSQ